MIIAVDFDNTLAITDYPTIIKPIRSVIDFIKSHSSDTIILNTCRHDKELIEAVEWCRLQGVEFDYVNENTVENIALYGDSRKIYADVYIDDKNVLISELGECRIKRILMWLKRKAR